MRKMIATLALIIGLALPSFAVSVSTTTPLAGPFTAILLQKNETLTYSSSGTFTGTALIEKSFDGTNWRPIGISTTNNSAGDFTGLIYSLDQVSLFRWNGSTITAGSFFFSMVDNDDLVTEQLNNKHIPITQTFDDSFRVVGDHYAQTVIFSTTFDVAVDTPTSAGLLMIDSDFDVYVSCGTDDLTGWLKVGSQ